ncbi:MAG: hypothetical protein L0228_18580 [Planctomycetes bacterium]|nr:hypothetical protein [Planctomycetota bacterium]
MTWKRFVTTVLLFIPVSPVFAAPTLSVVPEGIQSGNWVWRIDVGPDFSLAPDGTPLALELGFRLTGASLLSATNINPSEFDTQNPGFPIFGWEAYSDTNGDSVVDSTPPTDDEPVGLQVNTALGEIFAAIGSVDFQTPGLKPFLQIVAQGPANGGAPISNIEWLGFYGGKGRIAQLVPPPQFAANFDIYAGSASQMIPEPASGTLLAFGAIVAMLGMAARGHRRGDAIMSS